MRKMTTMLIIIIIIVANIESRKTGKITEKTIEIVLMKEQL